MTDLEGTGVLADTRGRSSLFFRVPGLRFERVARESKHAHAKGGKLCWFYGRGPRPEGRGERKHKGYTAASRLLAHKNKHPQGGPWLLGIGLP